MSLLKKRFSTVHMFHTVRIMSYLSSFINIFRYLIGRFVVTVWLDVINGKCLLLNKKDGITGELSNELGETSTKDFRIMISHVFLKKEREFYLTMRNPGERESQTKTALNRSKCTGAIQSIDQSDWKNGPN